MSKRNLQMSVLFFALVASIPALADPVGTYDVTGINPDSGGEYRGTVVVLRNGETYSVKWTIAGTESAGVGIGGRRDGVASTGAASADDDTITIGYGNVSGFGVAQYDLQADGSWKGHWAYAGGKKVSTETWKRAGGARSIELPKGPASTAMKPMGNSVARP